MRLKECPNCGATYYKTRKDQRFCNVWCRVKFNNRIAKQMRDKMKRHNLAIIRNYKLLNNLLNGAERLCIPYDRIKEKGFDVHSLTRIHQISGDTVFFIYDIAYKKDKQSNNIIITKTN